MPGYMPATGGSRTYAFTAIARYTSYSSKCSRSMASDSHETARACVTLSHFCVSRSRRFLFLALKYWLLACKAALSVEIGLAVFYPDSRLAESLRK